MHGTFLTSLLLPIFLNLLLLLLLLVMKLLLCILLMLLLLLRLLFIPATHGYKWLPILMHTGIVPNNDARTLLVILLD